MSTLGFLRLSGTQNPAGAVLRVCPQASADSLTHTHTAELLPSSVMHQATRTPAGRDQATGRRNGSPLCRAKLAALAWKTSGMYRSEVK
jgi:hypothetical protein